jgi:CDP-diacylglycerol---serine O-phosphatidyltransferase
MKQIPNLFTLLNLVFGCLAIVYILQAGIELVYDEYTGLTSIAVPEKIWMGSVFIGLAAVIDFVDGFVARLFKASSSMGQQLDSLADLVSFGVAPGLIIYQFLRLSWSGEPNGVDVSMAWLLPAFIVPCAAAWRLARFNLDTSQQYGFKGLPTPSAGILIASFPLLYWFSDNATIVGVLQNKWFWYGVILFISWLMISSLPLMALKFKDFSVKNNLPKFILAAATIVSALLLGWLAVPVVFILYILLSLAFKNKTA